MHETLQQDSRPKELPTHSHPAEGLSRASRRAARRWLGIAGVALLAGISAGPASAEDDRDSQILKNAREDRSVADVLLFYVPNRIFDVLDLVRARVRVGPGVAVRARATEGLDVGLGSYASVYAGLPGPRQEVSVPLPVGLETYTGIELGPGDAELEGGSPPNYSVTEFGISVQAVLVGIDVGVDPLEVLDLVAGLLLIDLRSDDF